MPNDIEAVIAGLDERSVAGACETVEAWAKAGRVDALVELASALEVKDEKSQDGRAAVETVADHVEDQLALMTGDAAVEALFALALRDRTRSVTVPRPYETRIRAFASRLGYGQPASAFLAALDRAPDSSPRHRELLACWMHEVVLRGTSLASDERAQRFAGALAKDAHPLARLPLSLLASEHEAPTYLPLYGDKGLGRAIERLTSGPMSARTIPPPGGGTATSAVRRDDPELAARLASAVRPWTERSNGKIEAKLFDLAPPVERDALGSWLLRALALDSTMGAPRLDVARVGVEAVFGALFAAASNGGAYSAGLGGAYGRLAAWASLGALAGAPAGAEVHAIDEAASRAAFLTFRAAGPWFHDVAWDLGALALRSDGRTAAVLAATDTD